MNARLSPRSGRRLSKVKSVVKPFLSLLDHVGIPEKEDLVRWQEIGVRSEATVLTGNVKFDSQGAVRPQKRDEFGAMLAQFPERPIAMAVSTFAGEEEYLAKVFEAVGAQAVIVPRHAERREEVRAALDGKMVLRSRFEIPSGDEVFVIDSTGELRDWTAHADVVVIGKSFFEKGGQNPSEAILAGVPVICGPHMANFEPLVSELKAAGGIRMVENEEELKAALIELLEDSTKQTKAALEVISKHDGAMMETIELFSKNREI
jgi:3-deoxy-D-manno-octulosonic-acid transferase